MTHGFYFYIRALFMFPCRISRWFSAINRSNYFLCITLWVFFLHFGSGGKMYVCILITKLISSDSLQSNIQRKKIVCVARNVEQKYATKKSSLLSVCVCVYCIGNQFIAHAYYHFCCCWSRCRLQPRSPLPVAW